MADEDIRITADTSQAQAELGKLGSSAEETSGKLDDLGTSTNKSGGSAVETAAGYGLLIGKVALYAKAIGGALEAVRDIAKATGDYEGANRELIDSVASLGQNIASLDLRGVAENLGKIAGNAIVAATGLDKTATALGRLASSEKARDLAEQLKNQAALVKAREDELKTLDRRSESLARQLVIESEAGGIQKYWIDLVQKTIDRYEELGEKIPPQLRGIMVDLGLVTKGEKEHLDILAKLGDEHKKEVEKLRESFEVSKEVLQQRTEYTLEAIKAVEEDGKVSVATNSKIKESLTELAQAYKDSGIVIGAELQAQIDKYKAVSTAAQEALEAKLAEQTKGSPLQEDDPAAGLQGSLEKTQEEVKKLESLPIISADQQRQLDEAKNRVADLNKEIEDSHRVFTIARDDFLSEAEAADAASTAWDVVLGISKNLEAEKRRLADTEGDVSRATDETTDSAERFGDAADDAAKSAGELGEGMGELADKAEETRKARPEEPLENMKDNAAEANKELRDMRDLLIEIIGLSSQVSL